MMKLLTDGKIDQLSLYILKWLKQFHTTKFYMGKRCKYVSFHQYKMISA